MSSGVLLFTDGWMKPRGRETLDTGELQRGGTGTGGYHNLSTEAAGQSLGNRYPSSGIEDS